MAKKPPRGRRANATGRSTGIDSHVRLYRWELETAAYRALSHGGRALLVEVRALFNGSNNGDLFLSVREAAKRLNSSKTFAADRFLELEAHGFIRSNRVGEWQRNDAFKLKNRQERRGEATTWILTDQPFRGALPTKDFMRWQPGAENHFSVRPGGHSVRPGGHLATKEQEKAESVRPGGHLTPLNPVSRSAPADTDSLPREGDQWGTVIPLSLATGR